MVEVHQMYSYAQFAHLLGVTKDTLYRWVRDGSIPSPVYLPSARFPAEVVAQVQAEGCKSPGYYQRTVSDRSLVGRLGAEAKHVTKKGKPRKAKHLLMNQRNVKARAAAHSKKGKGVKK